MLRKGEYKRRITIPMDKEILDLKEVYNNLVDSLEKEKKKNDIQKRVKSGYCWIFRMI